MADFRISALQFKGSRKSRNVGIVKTSVSGTSPVVQWLRLPLPMQGVRVPWLGSLVGFPAGCLVGERRSHMPCGQNTKTQNRSNTVTHSIKTSKLVHIKKFFKKKKGSAELRLQRRISLANIFTYLFCLYFPFYVCTK